MRDSGVYEKTSFDFLSVVSDLLGGTLPDDVGALVTYFGIAKSVGRDERPVAKVEMQSYEEHANEALMRIQEEVSQKYHLTLMRVYHLVGDFEPREPIVLVVVAARSRKNAFPALQEAVERYKSEPALWKREIYVDGSHQWVTGA